MSENVETNQNVENEPNVENHVNPPQNEPIVSDPSEEDVVSYKNHEKLLNQRKADQQKMRSMEAELEKMRNDIKAAETAKLEEKQEYKKLYEHTLGELESVRNEISEKEQALVNDHKMRAVEKELGGLKNNAYLRFIDLSNVVINEENGMVDKNSVAFEANRIRSEFPEIIAAAPSARINSQAPSQKSDILHAPKSAAELNKNQRESLKRNIIQDRLKNRE